MSTPLEGIPIERMSDIEVLRFTQNIEKERAQLDACRVKVSPRSTVARWGA